MVDAPRPTNTGFDPLFGDPLRRFREALAAQGVQTNIISGVRSPEEHHMAWANHLATISGRPLPYPSFGPVTKATPPGATSTHDVGLGADIQPANRADLGKMYALAPKYGLTYQGPSDPLHFNLANWQEARATQGGATPWSQVADVPSTMAQNVPPPRPPRREAEFATPGVGEAGPARPASPTPGPTLFAGVNPDARGMRNNNPGNLESNSWTAGLPGYKGSDGQFAIFDTPEHGAMALDQNLQHYGSKGLNTPLAIASTWAPAGDNNNPRSYGAQIAKSLGVGLNDKVDMSDPSVRAKITNTIALVENGPGASAGVKTTLPMFASVGASPSGATPGTTLTSIAATPARGAFGMGVDQGKDFLAGAGNLEKAMGGQAPGQSGQQQQDQPQTPQIQPLPPPAAMNVSPLLRGGVPEMISQALTGVSPTLYGTSLATIAAPPQANAAGQPAGGPPPPPGTSLSGVQQIMSMLNDMYGGYNG